MQVINTVYFIGRLIFWGGFFAALWQLVKAVEE